MRVKILIFLVVFSFGCSQEDNNPPPATSDSLAVIKSQPPPSLPAESPASLHKPTVLVLPPYDFNAGMGHGLNIKDHLEELIASDTTLQLIPFPYKKLMREPYSNVFDKKYCYGIAKAVPSDFIVMSKIGWPLEKVKDEVELNFSVKIFDVKADTQFLSTFNWTSVVPTDSLLRIKVLKSKLITELKTAANLPNRGSPQ